MRGLLIVALLAVSPALGGCGSVYYNVSANAAEARLAQAREVGAEKVAPYEYYSAEEHLKQAKVEAAEASYGDAAEYAEIAERYAQKAIDLAKSRRAGAHP